MIETDATIYGAGHRGLVGSEIVRALQRAVNEIQLLVLTQ